MIRDYLISTMTKIGMKKTDWPWATSKVYWAYCCLLLSLWSTMISWVLLMLPCQTVACYTIRQWRQCMLA